MEPQIRTGHGRQDNGRSILASDDYATDPDMDATIAAGFRSVREKWPNTLRMLEDA